MVAKRDFLVLGAATLGFLTVGRIAFAQATADVIPEQDADFSGSFAAIDLRNYNPTVDRTKGVEPATIEEETLAKQIVLGEPSGTSYMELAEYYRGLPQRNQSDEPYNAGWRKRWNPVIRQFFVATGTRPSGDVTSWCAAFVNSMLLHSGKQRTGSAAAQSFRSFGSATTNPISGDIVVFVDKTSPGHGHVGFFLARDPVKGVLVLGGNQSLSGNHHVVSHQWVREDGPRLRLHSFRDQKSFVVV